MPVSIDNLKGSTPILRRPLLYRGLYSRVAKRLGISRQFVAQVGGGKKTSKRVTAALLRAIREVERRERVA